MIWSHQGSTVLAKNTYNSIRSDLESSKSALKDINFEIYLQGSYGNDTNIRGDSDVDIVIELKSSFWPNITKLTPEQQLNFSYTYLETQYSYEIFYKNILETLVQNYGSNVSTGTKSIKIAPNNHRLKADVIPCLEYRDYQYFYSLAKEEYLSGIQFENKQTKELIINYPKIHYNNGVFKNSDLNTGGNYKPTVRMFKNARTFMVENKYIQEDIAPSYFIECILYNIPNNLFFGSFQSRYFAITNHLLTNNLSNYFTQNNKELLFGTKGTQWRIENAYEFINSLKELWNNWNN